MCGLAGILTPSPVESFERVLHVMALGLVHRGPDSEGVWADPKQGIGLVHRRLSVIDLSAAGAQPMISADERWVIAFNGEIYNHGELRKELENMGAAPEWRGHSDTETLLAALVAHGVEGALKKCVGMFAFALWDRKERALFLARDRMGEKPLYYGKIGDEFVFASELKALYRHPRWKGEIDRNSLALMMRHNCIPAPHSIFKNISKLPPATVLRLKAGDSEPFLTHYWDAREAALYGQSHPFDGAPEEAVERVEALLRQSLAGQMVADVPLGAFLSGGVDSSAVVAVMQAMSNRPVQTFSIGFEEKAYDEAIYARAVAKHLGTRHTELYVSPLQAMDVIPNLPSLYDEPFADSSQIPTFLVSELARRHVTVSLSGDGGDELFCGYSRYALARGLWPRLGKAPAPVRTALAKLITAIPPGLIDRLANAPLSLLPERVRPKNTGDKLHKLAGVLNQPSVEALYRSLISHWTRPEELVIGGREYPTPQTGPFSELALTDPVKCMMFLDQTGYLPDDILVKLDRASMGVSLESRVPLLDHRLVEFSWTLPLSILRQGGKSKWPLRQVLYRYVPPALIERPKTGFAIPLDDWLRGPLRAWAEDLLDETRLRKEGYFNPAPVRKAWDEHLSGSRNRQHHLWDVLMFQAWLAHYNSGAFQAGEAA